MILSDLVLPSRINQHWYYSGMDSLHDCIDKKHFLEFSYPVEYVYNSRGFRDDEWPSNHNELRECIWCIGDSFTVGIGQPLDHCWARVLSSAQPRRTINISMDGASNDWIYRRALDIDRCIDPVQMVVMWSYSHRRESHDTSLSDEMRRISQSKDSPEQDYAHWINLSHRLYALNPRIVQITIPDFDLYRIDPQIIWDAVCDPSWPACPKTILELEKLPECIINEMIGLHGCYDRLKNALAMTQREKVYNVIHIGKRLDWARDHHHFDILTAQWVVQQILDRIEI